MISNLKLGTLARGVVILALVGGVGAVIIAATTARQRDTPTVRPTVSPTPMVTPTPVESVDSDQPKRFKLQLSLSSITDLKVRERDRVMAGQVVSDRRPERERLATQLTQLKLRMNQLQASTVNPVVPATVAPLPPPTFLEQVATIQAVQLKVEEANKRLSLQERKLDMLRGLPEGEVPAATLEHEQKQLEQHQREVTQAIAQVQLAQSKLSQAQKARAYQEYQHSLELAKLKTQQEEQRLTQQQQIRERSFQLAQLQAQRVSLENQLAQLSAVRSPYDGTVKKVKWIEQNDSTIRVELVLDVRERTSPNPTPSSQPSPITTR
jgi:multidrug efflux pump subunit AcrA (membrane-fusion protein)